MHTSGDRPLILIVDDTPVNIQVLAEALTAEYRVKVATTGAAALTIARNPSSRPDLILLDVMMPGMDGYDVCRRLKRDAATRGIPVIFVTAKSDAKDEEEGLNLGAIDYIAKPFHLPIVKARVRNNVALKLRSDMLESLALIDGLTGVANRRRFDQALSHEWKRALRSESPLALIMADIDYFKAYNDHYGHGAGDLCLKAVANALAGELGRASDLLARYGGEEFIAIMADTEDAGARVLAERWCASVAALSLPHQHSRAADQVTISVGYASAVPSPQQSSNDLLALVDKRLYAAKAQGRNRICGASV